MLIVIEQQQCTFTGCKTLLQSGSQRPDMLIQGSIIDLSIDRCIPLLMHHNQCSIAWTLGRKAPQMRYHVYGISTRGNWSLIHRNPFSGSKPAGTIHTPTPDGTASDRGKRCMQGRDGTACQTLHQNGKKGFFVLPEKEMTTLKPVQGEIGCTLKSPCVESGRTNLIGASAKNMYRYR
jgi:hypothetical protein